MAKIITDVVQSSNIYI